MLSGVRVAIKTKHKMDYNCVEVTADIRRRGKTIRLWIDVTKNEDVSKSAIIDSIDSFFNSHPTFFRIEQLIQFLSEKVPHINAIQIVDSNENTEGAKWGKIAYTTSFADDVHG